MNFNHEELMLMMLYNTGTRLGLVQELRLMQCYLMPDETALRELSEGVIEKLKLMTDAISPGLIFAACGRRTYPLFQCGSVWYTELDNSEFKEVLLCARRRNPTDPGWILLLL